MEIKGKITSLVSDDGMIKSREDVKLPSNSSTELKVEVENSCMITSMENGLTSSNLYLTKGANTIPIWNNSNKEINVIENSVVGIGKPGRLTESLEFACMRIYNKDDRLEKF